MRREHVALLLIPASALILAVTVALWAKGFTVEEVTLVRGGILANETRGYEVYFSRTRSVEYTVLFLEARGGLDLRIAVVYSHNGTLGEALSGGIAPGQRGYIGLPRGALIDSINLKTLNPPTYIPPSLVDTLEPGVLRIEYKMPSLGVNAVLEVKLRIEWFNVKVTGDRDFTVKVNLYNGWDLVGVVEERCPRSCSLEGAPDEIVTSIDIVAVSRDWRATAILSLLGIASILTLSSSTAYIAMKHSGVSKRLLYLRAYKSREAG